jgi:AraC family transcriptional regulator of adaptative response/methylated-DNA-[protein]-cysteine methyltransferase
MAGLQQLSDDYRRIEKTIRFLEESFQHQPSLAEIAAGVDLSEHHFQRLFSRWVGISPKRYLQYLTKEHAKKMLADARSVLDTAYDAGLSGPGRLHDLFVACEAVTPGEYKTGGAGVTIDYGFHPSPFGECLLAVTERGICGLRFVQEDNREALIDGLKGQWPGAVFNRAPDRTRPLSERIFQLSANDPPPALHLLVRGTNFQIKVWEALLKIPPATVVSYSGLARLLGRPDAARAVGNAVGRNPVAFLIPCHRVIRKGGDFGYYGEGPVRKKAILAWEASRRRTAGRTDVGVEDAPP